VHRFHERETQFEVRANAIEEQQWQAELAVLARDAKIDAFDLDVFDEGFAHRW
jgi:hypothetical protein